MDIPFDILHFEEIKYLTVSDILRLCKTSKEMNNICHDPETWDYLLWRDFEIQSDTPRETYKEAYYVNKVTDIYREDVEKESEKMEINPEKVYEILSFMGYDDRNSVFQWRNLYEIKNTINTYGLQGGQVFVYDFDPFIFQENKNIRYEKGDYVKIVKVLFEILPTIFKRWPGDSPYEARIVIDPTLFQRIYNFYHPF